MCTERKLKVRTDFVKGIVALTINVHTKQICQITQVVFKNRTKSAGLEHITMYNY